MLSKLAKKIVKIILLVTVLLKLMPQIQAGKSHSFKNMQQLFDEIGYSTRDISEFAKSTFERDSLKPKYSFEQKCGSYLNLSLPCKDIEFKNDNEKIGKYLKAITDEELHVRIEKDPVAEGKVLFNDFLNTVMYKALQKRLKKFVHTMMSCSFFTSEEYRKLVNSKIFYPNDYDSGIYKWDSVYEDGKLNALSGKFYKAIGLKGTKSFPLDEFFLMTIAFDYRCSLRKIEKRPVTYKGATIKNLGPENDFYIDPKHVMTASITFLHKKDFDKYCAASYSCYVCGGDKMISEVKKEKISWLGEFWRDSGDSSSGIDLELMKQPPIICGEFKIISGSPDSLGQNLFDQCSDFIIDTEPEILRELTQKLSDAEFLNGCPKVQASCLRTKTATL
jgi:hypothetical protein